MGAQQGGPLSETETPACEELEYYRAVEDLFARLRGTPFLLSPADWELLRSWWRDGVPFAAVAAGLSEVFQRRQERDGDPVSSLRYCRHAVARHARRLLATAPAETGRVDVAGALDRVTAAVAEAAGRLRGDPALGEVIDDLLRAVSSLPRDASPVALDELLGRLETAALGRAAAAMPVEWTAEIDAEAERAASGIVEDRARARAVAALRLKLVRERLELPRLELAPCDP